MDLKNSEETVEKKRNNPNCLSHLFLCWMCPVFYSGNKRNVEEEDLIVPGQKYDSDRGGELLEKYWLEELESAYRANRKPSLWKALRRTYWLSYMPAGLLVLTNAMAKIVQTLLFSRLLTFWSTDSDLTFEGACYYAGGMLLAALVAGMTYHHNNLYVQSFSLKVKVACGAIMFRKLLRMNQTSASEVASGKIVNLVANDMTRFDYGLLFLHHMWVIPIQAIVVLWLLWQAAGYAPYIGLFSVVILILPVQFTLTRLTGVFRRETALRTDKRIRLMTEIINGIQVIKMYAWEKPFQAVVKAARAMEIRWLKRSLLVRSMFMSFMLYMERTIMFFTALTLVLTGSSITATVIYPIQQYFSLLNLQLTIILPFAIASLSEMLVTIERIQQVMVLDEREDLAKLPISKGTFVKNLTFNGNSKIMGKEKPSYIMPKTYISNTEPNGRAAELVPRKSIAGEYAIELSGANASWTNTNDSTELTLKNVTMRVRKGKLTAIIGPVGSGKSSLLQVFLRELPLFSGSMYVNGRVSYACQESWLFPSTVRENILFGLPYDVAKYKEVCRVCSLVSDFKQFPYGDLSLVGDRGVSLSGGQRARINLARAIYRDADIYLLDDPLSAVDANVGRFLFEHCLKGYLRGKTCILVTHQIHFLQTADFLVVLNEGHIQNMGTYNDVLKTDNIFTSLLEKAEVSSPADGDAEQKQKRPSFNRGASRTSVISEDIQEEIEQIQAAEERQTGTLKWSVVKTYLTSVQSWCLVFFTFFTLMFAQGMATSADYFLSYWTNNVDQYELSLPADIEPDPSLDTQVGPLTNGQHAWILGFITLAIIIFTQIRVVLFVTMATRASQNIHDNIFLNLTRSIMRFFDTNPSGRVLNRFSKDMGAMDELLPRAMLEALQMYLSMVSIMVLNAVALPWTLIPTAVMGLLFIFFLKFYLNAAQAVKRLDGTMKSPVFGMISSTISGLSTIRSSNQQDRIIKMFDLAQDGHSCAFYTFLGGSNAFALYLELLCIVYLGFIIFLFLLLDYTESSVIPVGSVGLAVSQTQVLSFMLQMAARYTVEFLAQMTGVERCLEYSELPKEQHIDDGPTKPPQSWPSEGCVTFENVYLHYGSDDPPVLKDLTFEIKSGWKVGVVGRTGAGKSSLISALFRLYKLEGNIKIDDINTVGVAKQLLRTKISIIPQEPVLFSASLRYNLDPFDMYSDDQLWKSLEQVELKDSIPALDFKVSDGGSNFSVGQRQLICLARAILRSNKVLVMDEATANVDPQTDNLIQKTIRRAFGDCTVITVAHRLNTIMDSDRVLVMDKGKLAEYDCPHILLNNSNSILSSMVKETGDSMVQVLKEMARKKYDSDRNQLAR